MLTKNLSLLLAAVVLTACAGKQSEKVESLQRSDKHLSCKEILLEQNEAEFYRKSANNNKNPELKNLIMPMGYISTYVNAQEAIDASNARVEYLNRIYDILDCDNPHSQAAAARMSAPAPQPYGGYNANAGYAPQAYPQYYQAPVPSNVSYRGDARNPEGADEYWRSQGNTSDSWYW